MLSCRLPQNPYRVKLRARNRRGNDSDEIGYLFLSTGHGARPGRAGDGRNPCRAADDSIRSIRPETVDKRSNNDHDCSSDYDVDLASASDGAFARGESMSAYRPTGE